MSDAAGRKKAGQDGNNNANSRPISLLYRLLFSALGGLIAYGILWSVATYPSSILLTVPGVLVLILAAVIIVSMMTTQVEKRKLNGKRGIMRNPLIAIIFSYLVALTEIFMVREIEAPALTSNYYPGMKKKWKMTTIIQTRNRTTRHIIGC